MLPTISIGSLTCKSLHPNFVAEVSGIDFSLPVDPNQIRDVISAMDRFGVCVFRNTGLDDLRHIAFSRQLGELEKVPKFRGPNVPDRFAFPELFDAGNTDRDGNIIQKGSRRWWYNKGNTLWHVDSSFNQHRSKYSLLLAHQIPRTGGNTNFADSRHAYRDLPESKKSQLSGLVAEHDLWHSRRLAAPEEYKEPSDTEKAAKPPAFHKLVQLAPDGEDDTLYVAAHASGIIGLPHDEGLQLITELIQHCTQTQYVCAVKWQQAGDLVIWGWYSELKLLIHWLKLDCQDNRQVMHRGTPFSDQMEVRDMRRTTVFDDSLEHRGVKIGEC